MTVSVWKAGCLARLLIRLSNKKESRERDSPPAAGRFSDMIPFRRSAFLPGGLFNYIGEFGELVYVIKMGAYHQCDSPFFILFNYKLLSSHPSRRYFVGVKNHHRLSCLIDVEFCSRIDGLKAALLWVKILEAWIGLKS